MASRKLMVEIHNAKNLMPKDGLGTASAFVTADFDGQRRRTTTVHRNLNPAWEQTLEFLVVDPDLTPFSDKTLELNVYNDKIKDNNNNNSNKKSTFLGRVKISGSGFGASGSDPFVYYPLEKRSVFSQVKGEIGVRVWVANDVAKEVPPEAKAEKEEEKEKPPEIISEKKEEEKLPENPAPAAAEPTPPPPPPPVAAPPPQEKPPVAEPKKIEKTPNSRIIDLEHQMMPHGRDGNNGRSGLGQRYDLVDRVPFLFVRVVKAKMGVITTEGQDSSGVYGKLVIGTHSIKTRTEKGKDWDQVFAFDKEGLNSTLLQVSVWVEKKTADDKTDEASLGTVCFDLAEVPKRVPPDSPLAPQWYTLENGPDENPNTNDVMLSVWIGTQADEAFQEAWQSDSGGMIPETRAKVYLSPKLWYLRVTVIQTQDLQLGFGPDPKTKNPDLFVKAQLGPQIFKTGRTTVGPACSSSNPTWNEDLVFVAAEPFEPFLVITVEDTTNSRSVGQARVHMASVDRRTDDRAEPRSRWFNLVGDDDVANTRPYKGRIHVRVFLEGGYHVLDEAAHATSDVRPTARQLAKPPIGILEVGIRGATNLLPVKTVDGTRGTMDAYVVAKYGPKWVRTRTILDRFNPRWNEQYAWDVYDPCTVLTIGVFDNGRYKQGKDVRVGKLRVRLSTLDTNRVYNGSYALTVLLPSGPKKMGEVEVSVRFTCSSWISLIQAYASPILPRMHYVRPLGPSRQDILRHTAMRIVTARLARSEPALGQEVVQFMIDSDTHTWSMRRSKANWFRLVACLSKADKMMTWLDGVRTWAHPATTVLVHFLILAVVLCPNLVLPTVFMYAFLILGLRSRWRERAPPTMSPRLSCVDIVGADEYDEEFDGFPTTGPSDLVRARYDRLRALAGRAQTFLGDVAAQGERLDALFSWKDPRATGIFALVCFVASLMFYAVPFKVFVLGSGFYYLRHPRFRGDMPSLPLNFFRRLPSLADQII